MKQKLNNKQIHLKRVFVTYWNDIEDYSKGIEQLEHLFVSIDKESWKEINFLTFESDMSIADYEEIKELLDKPQIKIGESFFRVQSRLFIYYKNRKIPKMKILEETTVN